MEEEKKVCRTNHLYTKRMTVDELADFMSERQEWNLAPTCHAAQHLEKITEFGDCSAKDIAVEGTDGIVYSGAAESHHHWRARDRSVLVFRFVLGKNQQDSKYLDDRMRQLGYNADQVQLMWSDE